MNNILQYILIAGSFSFLVFVITLVKKSRLQVKYSLLWLTLAFAYLVLAIFPGILDLISEFLHIKEKVNTLFFVTTFFIIVLCFFYNLILSKQSSKIRTLVQEISILRSEINKTDKSDSGELNL